jgi:phospholipase/carboxylesterase
MTLKTHIIPSVQPTTASIIWLHGLGASADDFVPMVPNLHLTQAQSIRFIFPNAPLRPITISGGMLMPAWYDILGFSMQAREDLSGLQTSQLAIDQLIEQEITQGIAPERIVLGGFSPGGASSLFAGLQSRYRLGGLVSLSAYLPCADHVLDHASLASLQTPIFMAHGEQDPLVLHDWAVLSKDKLASNGHSVEWHSFPTMAHEASLAELALLSVFLNKVLAPL